MTAKIVSGIYLILNTKTRKIYIGQAQNIRKRWNDHRHALRHNKHPNRHLQAAWNKYAAKAFKFSVLEYCAIDRLDSREQHYLNIYIPKGDCYNLAVDATSPMRGRKNTPESNTKRSDALKGRTLSLEHRKKIGMANKGGKGSTGRIVTAATRQKLSVSHEHRLPMSDETKEKISIANRGRKLTPAHREKIVNASKGRKHSLESKQKMSDVKSGQYIATSPDGIEYRIKNLRQFCSENELSDGSMGQVISGKRKHHKGWKCRKLMPSDN